MVGEAKGGDQVKFQPLQASDRLGIVGKSGSGKSHCGKALLQREMERGWRIIAYDVEDEFSRHGRKTAHVTLGPLTHRATWDEFARDPAHWLTAERLALSIIPIDNDNAEECAKEAGELKALVKAYGDVLVYWSEMGAYHEHARAALDSCATRGRHWGCPMVFESQRMVHIPPNARAQLTQLESFLQDHPADLDALRERTRLADPEFADRVTRLRVGESEFWRDPLTKEKSK